MNATDIAYRNPLSLTKNQQYFMYIISVSLSVLTVFIVFIVPFVIIMFRIQRRQHHQQQMNFRESQCSTEFM
ncbi:hypothetical protein I4U23_025807 [Adineta vaga]|nr:hypothetical protein I4U23_025807 [Adineta vaga]